MFWGKKLASNQAYEYRIEYRNAGGAVCSKTLTAQTEREARRRFREDFDYQIIGVERGELVRIQTFA